MARRDIPMNEVAETIYQWHKGMKIQHISRSLGLDRKTVRKYLGMARSLGITQGGALPDEQELAGKLKGLVKARDIAYDAPALDLVARYKDDIEKLLEDKNITAKQVWRLLKETHGITVGYSTVKRYLRSAFSFGRTKTTVRMETPPGEEAQVDFGYAGLMYDPATERKRRTWAFIMTLSASRHKFVRFVFGQDIAMWLDCHERAFQWFMGVPQRIILDNLKSGVLKADIYDPTVNRAYADMERFFGFVADPAKVRMAQHKGKVERAVPTVRKHLLAGRIFKDINEANERALHWCRDEIGMELHGTTKKKPYLAFLAEEKALLAPLPSLPFERPLWKQCTVHPDHHIVFDKSYYSLPTRFIGRKEAAEFGPHTEALITAILREGAMKNLRKSQAILRLAEKYSADIEKVAERALLYGNMRYRSIKAMLENGIVHEEKTHQAFLSDLGQRFLRDPAYFGREVHHD